MQAQSEIYGQKRAVHPDLWGRMTCPKINFTDHLSPPPKYHRYNIFNNPYFIQNILYFSALPHTPFPPELGQ